MDVLKDYTMLIQQERAFIATPFDFHQHPELTFLVEYVESDRRDSHFGRKDVTRLGISYIHANH